jgi:hypothetical protein
MRICLTLCALALASCGPEGPGPVALVVPPVPAAVLAPCEGWQGPPPLTAGALLDAAAAEKRGRQCANARLGAVADMLAAARGPN